MLTAFATTIIFFWAVIGAVLIANGYFVYKVRAARYRVMQTLAEKGQPVPPELLSGTLRQAHSGLMRGGIVMICLGLALGIFLWSMTAPSPFHGPVEAGWLPTIALFPFLLGVALMVMAQIDRRPR